MTSMTQPHQTRTPQQRCAKKLGTPGPAGMKVCNEPAEYVRVSTAGLAGGPMLTGWRHVDRSLDSDHYPVPAHWLS